jgi:hypothetical protein
MIKIDGVLNAVGEDSGTTGDDQINLRTFDDASTLLEPKRIMPGGVPIKTGPINLVRGRQTS